MRAIGATTIVCLGMLLTTAKAQPVKSVEQAYQILHAKDLSPDQAKALQTFVENRYKKVDLQKANHRVLMQRTDDGGGYVLWCLKAPKDAKVTVFAEKKRHWRMRRLGDSNLFVASEKFPNFSSVHFRFDVNGKRLPHTRENRFGFEHFPLTGDSLEKEGVPKGELKEMGTHISKKYYKGAQRKWWVYVPVQYKDAKDPAKLVVFNDGGGWIKGPGNACTVLDNLIHQKKIPVMIAVFVNPGDYPNAKAGKKGRSNRGNEYDTCTPRFATFLDEEILPIVRKDYKISQDPWDHAIIGTSSGASCAFTAAWHRNDLFRRVGSFVGSYCDFRPVKDYPAGGKETTLPADQFGPWKTAHDYPALIRKTEPPKPIKIFLQDGENDLDNVLGNWFQNNLRMQSALAFAGYDHTYEWGKGMHSKRHGASILPKVLIWLWDDSNAKGGMTSSGK